MLRDFEQVLGPTTLTTPTSWASAPAFTLYELRHAVRAGLRALQRQACLLDGFLAHAGLQIQLRT